MEREYCPLPDDGQYQVLVENCTGRAVKQQCFPIFYFHGFWQTVIKVLLELEALLGLCLSIFYGLLRIFVYFWAPFAFSAHNSMLQTVLQFCHLLCEKGISAACVKSVVWWHHVKFNILLFAFSMPFRNCRSLSCLSLIASFSV